MPLLFRTAARSDVGVVRVRNEDSGYAAPRVAAVADGMGGHAAGELASATAIATLAEIDGIAVDPDDMVRVATEIVDVTSDRIAEATREDENRSGMGTTLTSVMLIGNAFAVLHVGDSRAYLWRNNRLVQITKDHTYVQTLIDSGQINEIEAQVHPRRNLLMRAIDGTPGVMVDVSLREARVEDRILVCSDGLTGAVSRDSIRASMFVSDPTACVTELVEKALAGGAPDNVTVVIADVVESTDSDAAIEPVVVGAAAEPRNRVELPDVVFPEDVQPDVEGVLRPLLSGTDLSAISSTYREYRLGRGGYIPGTRRQRTTVALIVAVLLAASAVAVGLWSRSQWFVSGADDRIVISNGIDASVLGIKLANTVDVSSVRLSDLPEYDQRLVTETIHADSRADAQAIVTRLACRATPPVAPCPTAARP